MWNNFFGQMFTLMVAATIMRLAAEPRGGHSNPLLGTEGGTSEEMFPHLSAQRREWAKKAVEGYARKQEKKWLNWDEAMFIPSGSARQSARNKK